MALLQNWLDEQDKKNKGNFSVSKGGSSVLGGAAGSQVASPQAEKTKPLSGTEKGTGFTNLNTYLNTNKEAAGQMAGKISGADIAEGSKDATDLQSKQQKAIDTQKQQNQAKSFDLNLLNDPMKLTDEQKTAFSSAYGQSYDPSKWQADENFTTEGQKTVLDRYDTRTKGYEDQVSRQARMGALTQGPDAIFKSGRDGNYTQGLGKLDAFLLGGQQEGLKKGSEEAKAKVAGQITSGEAARQQAGKDIQSAIDAARSGVQSGYNTKLTESDKAIPGKMSDIQYEKYSGPSAYENVDMMDDVRQADYYANVDRVAAINARNRDLYNKAKSEFESGGKSALAKRNALASLTGQAGKNVDFSKLTAPAYQDIQAPTITYKVPVRQQNEENWLDRQVNNIAIEPMRNTQDYTTNTLKTEADYLQRDTKATERGDVAELAQNQRDRVRDQGQNLGEAVTKNIPKVSVPKPKKPSWL